jgi:uncharacterized protein (TIGR02145 family)
MKNSLTILLVVAVLVFAFNSCKKDDDSTANNPYNGKTTAQFNPDITYGTMTDQDGNVYKTVSIGMKSGNGGGQQTWMAENLRTTKYNDGTDIPNVTDNAEWAALTSGAYSSYNNTLDADSIASYGLLYNFFALDTKKLAPAGWHVPTEQEWLTMIAYSGGQSFGGGRMKETGTTHWAEPNYMGNNAYGFTALPSGMRYYLGDFTHFGKKAVWWTADQVNSTNTAVSYSVGTDGASCYSNTTVMNFGYSIRLVKD